MSVENLHVDMSKPEARNVLDPTDVDTHSDTYISNDIVDNTASPANKCFWVKMREPEYKKNVFHTVSLCCSFLTLGVVGGQRGPSLLDLQMITDVDTQQSSLFITAMSTGYTCGSFLVAGLYDHTPKSVLLFVSTLTTGLLTAVIPFCSNYILMLGIIFLGAMPMAGIDIGGNADIIRIWGKEGRSYMQAIHFCFAVGSVIGPLVTEPFLTPRQTGENLHHTNLSRTTLPEMKIIYHDNATTDNGRNGLDVHSVFKGSTSQNSSTYLSFQNSSPHTLLPNSTIYSPIPNMQKRTTFVYIAYIIVAAACVVISLPFLFLHFQQQSPVMEHSQHKNMKTNYRRNSSLKRFIITLLIIVFLNIFYIAIEDTMANFMLMFVVNTVKWTKAEGTLITSTYWATFAISRFLGIFLIRCLSPSKCLFVVYSLLIVSCTGLLFSAIHSFHTGVWVSITAAGLSMGVIFPTNYNLISEHVTVSGKIASLISITASVGSIGNPAVLGPLMQHYSPMWYVYLILGESVGCLVCFLVLLVFSRTHQKTSMARDSQTVVVSDATCELLAKQPDGENNKKSQASLML